MKKIPRPLSFHRSKVGFTRRSAYHKSLIHLSGTGKEADLPQLLRPEGAGVDDGEPHQIYQGTTRVSDPDSEFLVGSGCVGCIRVFWSDPGLIRIFRSDPDFFV